MRSSDAQRRVGLHVHHWVARTQPTHSQLCHYLQNQCESSLVFCPAPLCTHTHSHILYTAQQMSACTHTHTNIIGVHVLVAGCVHTAAVDGSARLRVDRQHSLKSLIYLITLKAIP